MGERQLWNWLTVYIIIVRTSILHYEYIVRSFALAIHIISNAYGWKKSEIRKYAKTIIGWITLFCDSIAAATSMTRNLYANCFWISITSLPSSSTSGINRVEQVNIDCYTYVFKYSLGFTAIASRGNTLPFDLTPRVDKGIIWIFICLKWHSTRRWSMKRRIIRNIRQEERAMIQNCRTK